MLTDEYGAVDANDFMVWKGELQLTACLFVVGGLAIGGAEDGAVDDEEIGVGGRESLVAVADGVGHGKGNQAVGTAVGGAECLQLGFHVLEVGMLGVGGVGGLDIGNGVVRAEACEGVDVSVGVVALQMSVVEPEDALGVEVAEQALLNLRGGEVVAVGGEEAGGGGEDGAFSVALDASAFEYEVEAGLVVVAAGQMGMDADVDLVVEMGGKLESPSVELVVEEGGGTVVVAEEGDEGMVACPGVVGGAGDDVGTERGVNEPGVSGDDEQRLTFGNFACHVVVAVEDFVEHGCPVGVGMWPCELDKGLAMPFGGKIH